MALKVVVNGPKKVWQNLSSYARTSPLTKDRYTRIYVLFAVSDKASFILVAKRFVLKMKCFLYTYETNLGGTAEVSVP